MKKSLKILVVEDSGLLKQAVATFFDSQVVDEKINLVGVTTKEEICDMISTRTKFDLVFCAMSINDSHKTIELMSLIVKAYPEPGTVLGISDYKNYQQELLKLGCPLACNVIDACRFISDKLESPKEVCLA